MNKHLFVISTASAVLQSLGGCSSDDQTNGHQQSAASTRHSEERSDDSDDQKKQLPPRVGMTMAQVRARYGEPDSVNETSSGESWMYGFRGPALLNALPIYATVKIMTDKPRSLFIKFGANGRVVSYSSTTSRSAGDMMVH